MPKSTPTKHYWLYALRLEQGKYYIGITSRKDPRQRIKEHMNGFYSAQWAKRYRPLEVHEILDIGDLTEPEAKRVESKRTIQYMKKYGLQSARGGKFNYSGKYVSLGMWLARREDFYMLLGVLVMLGCMIGLYLIARSK